MDERCSLKKRDNTTRRIWFALLENLIETGKHNTGFQRPLRNSFASRYNADGRNMLCQCAALLLGAHECRNEAENKYLTYLKRRCVRMNVLAWNSAASF